MDAFCRKAAININKLRLVMIHTSIRILRRYHACLPIKYGQITAREKEDQVALGLVRAMEWICSDGD